MKEIGSYPNDAKAVFKKCMTCSRTFAHILNREFGHHHPDEEKALDSLAGGIANHGHQCGMLWGSVLAIGAEAYRREKDPDKAIALAVTASQHIIESFVNRTSTVTCREIIGLNLNSVLGFIRFMIRVNLQGMDNTQCFNLAEDWAPEAIAASNQGIEDSIQLTQKPQSCATKMAYRMGASEEEAIMASGFAGGLGLSGAACGALGTALWLKTLRWVKENPDKTPPMMKNPMANELVNALKEITDGETICENICGQRFKDINEHSEYVHQGGCEKLIQTLSTA